MKTSINQKKRSERARGCGTRNWFRERAPYASSIIQIKHGAQTPPLRHAGQQPLQLAHSTTPPAINLFPHLSQTKLALFHFTNKLIHADNIIPGSVVRIESSSEIACGCRLIAGNIQLIAIVIPVITTKPIFRR